MNHKRRLIATAVATAGLIGVTTLAGAASASAAPLSTPPVASATKTPPPKDDAPEVKKPAEPAARPDQRAGKPDDRREDRVIARVKAAVLDKYPKIKIISVKKHDDGWTVVVKIKGGQPAVVEVDGNFRVGRLVPVKPRRHD